MNKIEVLYTEISDIKQNTLEKKQVGGLSFYEGKISFNITKTKLANGANRNYNPADIKSFVQSPQTQQFITRGWCVINYGHRTRSKDFFHLGQEYHPITEDIHEPLGRVTKVSMNGKILKIEFVLTETKHNNLESVIKFIKLGIGGFSTVFNRKEGLFLGMDYVLSRNFVDNQIGVVMDNLCLSGACDIKGEVEEITDEILQDNRELKEEATALLLDDTRVKRLNKMVKKISDFKQLKELNEKLTSDLEVRESEIRSLEQENKQLLNDIIELGKTNQKIRVEYDNATNHISDLEKANKDLSTEIDAIKKESDTINKALRSEGLKYTNNGITLDVDIFSNLFKQAYKQDNTIKIDSNMNSTNSETYIYIGKGKGKNR